jgi:hypothetical protein
MGNLLWLWLYHVCETESKVLETATLRRLAHSLLSGKTPKPLQTSLHAENPHFTIIIRLTSEHPSQGSL